MKRKFYFRLGLATLLALFFVGVGQVKAQTQVSETYDFQGWMNAAAADINPIAVSTDYVEEASAKTKCYVITSEPNGNDLNGRFALSNTSKNKVWLRYKKNYPKNTGLFVANGANSYFSILNLKNGDKVTVTWAAGALTFKSANATYDSNGTTTSVAVDGAVTSGTTYTIATTDATTHLDMYLAAWTDVQKVIIQTTADQDKVSDPTINVTGAKGTSRVVTITPGTSTLGNAVKTYYTTDGSDPTAASTEYTAPITVDATSTVKAISIAGEVKSDIESLEVEAGTEVALNAPTYSLTSLTSIGSNYNPTYTFTSDNSKVIGAPTATLSATFDGTAVDLTNGTYTFTKAGKLTVIATADGYASASTDVAVSDVDYVKTYAFDASNFTVNNGAKEAAGQRPVNGTGCSFYNASDCVYDLDTRITLSDINFAWAVSKNKGYGLFTRISSKGKISYNLTDGQLIEFAGANVVANAADKSTSFPQYTYISGINVYTLAGTTTSVTINTTSSLASFSNIAAVTVPEGVTIYKASAPSDNTVTLTKVDDNVIPANTGVILYKENGGDVTLTYGGTAKDGSYDGNALKAATSAYTVSESETVYALVAGEQAIAKVSAGVAIPAGKAYLPVAASTAAKLNLVFGGSTTGINNINVDKDADKDAPAFNLAGQRVGNGFRGIVIKGGKKYIQK